MATAEISGSCEFVFVITAIFGPNTLSDTDEMVAGVVPQAELTNVLA